MDRTGTRTAGLHAAPGMDRGDAQDVARLALDTAYMVAGALSLVGEREGAGEAFTPAYPFYAPLQQTLFEACEDLRAAPDVLGAGEVRP